MKTGKRWSRNELIIAINLYCKLPFGQLDQRTPIIIEVAEKLGRTPSSLAMKLGNFASLDPVQQARGIKGLRGASQADRAIWEEFTTNWAELAVESEERLQKLLEMSNPEDELMPARQKGRNLSQPKVPDFQSMSQTETEATVRVRRGQDFFRKAVIVAYETRCCITGNPVPELLIASHILPWSSYPEHRLNPHNGLCLARTQDAAFERGLISFDKDYRLILSPHLENFLPEQTLDRNFAIYRGTPIRMPKKFQPNPDFIRIHREQTFRN